MEKLENIPIEEKEKVRLEQIIYNYIMGHRSLVIQKYI